MKKTIALLLLLSLCLWSYPLYTYAEGSTLEVRVSHSSILLDGTVTVEVLAKNIEDIAGADILLQYDANKLELASKTISLNSNDIMNMQGNTPALEDTLGKARIVFGLKKGKNLLQGEVVSIATLQFKAIALGATTLSLDSQSQLIEELNIGSEVNYRYTNPSLSGEVGVNIYQTASLHGKVTLSDGVNPLNTQVVLLQGDISIQQMTTTADGSFAFANIEEGQYTLSIRRLGYETFQQVVTIDNGQAMEINSTLKRIKEDVNRDGFVDLKDLVFIGARFGLNLGAEGWNEDADINKDTKIDMLDILYVSRSLD